MDELVYRKRLIKSLYIEKMVFMLFQIKIKMRMRMEKFIKFEYQTIKQEEY